MPTSEDQSLPSFPLTRRGLLRLLGGGLAAAGLGSACQPLLPPVDAPSSAPSFAPATQAPSPTPTRPPTPTRAPVVQTPGAPARPALRIAVDVDPDTLDPAGQTTTTVQNIVDLVVEPLITLRGDGKLAPGLAERWEQSADGKTYRFFLRPGVRFQDGTPLTAAAAKASLERFLSPQLKVPLRAPFDGSVVDAIVAENDLTLAIVLTAPFSPLPAKLACTETGIVSPSHVASFPDGYSEDPIGTGPYRLRERRKGESVLLERWEGYWGQRPYYPLVQFRVVPEAATRESLLLANQVDLIIYPPPSDLPTLQRSAEVRVQLPQTSRSIFVAMDLTLPGGTPLAIKKARQALNHAVDREGIIKAVLFGAATPMDAPLAPSLIGYSRTGPYPYDPGRARQLLQEAGTPGLFLKFAHATGRSVQDIQATQVAQAIAGNLREVGVICDLVGADWPSLLAAVNVPPDQGTNHMHLFNWTPSFLDASQQMGLFSQSQWPPHGMATSHYSDPGVEQSLSQALREAVEQKRLDEYAQAQRQVWDDAPWIFLWVPHFPIVHSARIKGIGTLPTEKLTVTGAEPA